MRKSGRDGRLNPATGFDAFHAVSTVNIEVADRSGRFSPLRLLRHRAYFFLQGLGVLVTGLELVRDLRLPRLSVSSRSGMKTFMH